MPTRKAANQASTPPSSLHEFPPPSTSSSGDPHAGVYPEGCVPIRCTQRITELLVSVTSNESLDKGLRSRVLPHVSAPHVPWDVLDEACAADQKARGARGEGGGPHLYELVSEAGLSLKGPEPRKRPKELEERLARLQRQLEERQYKEMVRGATRGEDLAEELREGGFRTYKDQIGFGINVLVKMFTLFVVFYSLARVFTTSEAGRMLCGLLGGVVAMLADTILLITKTTYTQQDRLRFAKKYE